MCVSILRQDINGDGKERPPSCCDHKLGRWLSLASLFIVAREACFLSHSYPPLWAPLPLLISLLSCAGPENAQHRFPFLMVYSLKAV